MFPYVGGNGLEQPGSINAPSDDSPVAIAFLRVMSRDLFISFSDNHSPELLFKTGDYNHDKVNDKE